MSLIFGQGGAGSGGGGGGSNASVGATGAPAPSSATEIGIIVANGDLEGVSATNPLRIDPTGTTTQPVEINDGTNVMGIMAVFGTSPGAVYALNANASLFSGTTALSHTGTSLNVNITGGGSGGTQYTDETAETAGAFTITVAGLYNGTDVVGLRGDSSNNLLVNLATAIPAGTNLLGKIEVYDGTNILFTSSHPGYVQFGSAQHVIVDSGGGGGTQYTDLTAETAGAFTGTAALGYNGTDVVALRMDASNNLLVNLATALPAGTNVIGHVINDASTAVIGHVIIDSGTITTVSTVTAVTAITNALPAGTNLLGQIEVSDGTNVLFTSTHPGYVQGSVTVSGSTNIFEVSPTTAANTKTNPFFTEISDGTNTVTTNSTTFSSKYGLDVNLLGTLGTAFTTAGFVDIKGADGNVFVRQTTAANLNATVVGTGTFAVQEATLDAALIAQEASTSGVKGLTVFGAVTTAAPTYTTGKSDALSLDVSGNLRTSVNNTVAVNQTGSSVLFNVTTGSASVTNATIVGNSDVLPSTSNITARDTATTSTTYANGQIFITGAPTASSFAEFVWSTLVPGTVEIFVTGTWTGTLQVELSPDNGTTYIAQPLQQLGISTLSATFTNNFCGQINAAGYTRIRVRATAAWTGTATVKVVESQNPSIVALSPVPAFAVTQSTSPWIVAGGGTAGSAASGVVTVQGISGGTTIPVTATIAASQTIAVTNTGTFAVQASIAASQTIAVTNVGTFAVQATLAAATTNVIGTVRIIGNTGATIDAAPAATPPTNAIQTIVLAGTALPTAVSTAQTVVPMADKFGRQVVLTNSIRDLVGVQTTQIASSSSETTIVTTGASGVFNDITGFQITNQTATAVTVTIKDNTGGTTRKVYDLAANGGIVVHFDPPLPQGTAANTWTATLSSAAVTVDINVDYIKNK